ncbi:hypothetical protein D3C80_795170 [compost metagenome]
MVMVVIRADTKTVTTVGVHGNSPKVAPVMMMDSPRQMMTNRPTRSARCAPSTSQSMVLDRPRPGTKKASSGPVNSSPRATSQINNRVCPSARPPLIQNTAPSRAQVEIRWKFAFCVGDPRTALRVNRLRPT